MLTIDFHCFNFTISRSTTNHTFYRVAKKSGNLEFDNFGKKKPGILQQNHEKTWNFFLI